MSAQSLEALFEIIRRGTAAQLETALAALPDIDAFDGEHGTPLHVAVHLGDLDAVRQILARGAAVDARFRGDTPLLRVSAEKGDVGTAIVEHLIAGGADVNATGSWGDTLLMRLASWDPARNRTLPTARILLAAGADPNARNVTGHTALHRAASAYAIELVDLLLAHAADPHARSWSYMGGLLGGAETPLDGVASVARVATMFRPAAKTIADHLRQVMATAPARPEPPHGTTHEAMSSQLVPYLGAPYQIDNQLLDDSMDRGTCRLTFFAWHELAESARAALRAAHCVGFTDTMIPFALVGSPELHQRGATLDDLPPKSVFGTLFWELGLGSGERCPIWYFRSPGKSVHGLKILGSPLSYAPVFSLEELRLRKARTV